MVLSNVAFWLSGLGFQLIPFPQIIPEMETVALVGEAGMRAGWHGENWRQGVYFSIVNFYMVSKGLQGTSLSVGPWAGAGG